MTDIERLEKEIELLIQKIALTKELRALETQQPQPALPPHWSPFVAPYRPQQEPTLGCSGGFHEYPMPWLSTSPPFCKRCGQMAQTSQPYYTVSNSNTVITPYNAEHHNVLVCSDSFLN